MNHMHKLMWTTINVSRPIHPQLQELYLKHQNEWDEQEFWSLAKKVFGHSFK